MSYQDGLTLMHEHMTIDLTPGDLGTDSFDELASDLRLIYDHGVRNIVDLTNQTMGRAPEYVRRLSEETGINIFLSTGTYLETFSGTYISERSVDEIAKDAVRDLTEGIDDTGIKADVIGEIAWSGPEERSLEKRPGKPIVLRQKRPVPLFPPMRAEGSSCIPRSNICSKTESNRKGF